MPSSQPGQQSIAPRATKPTQLRLHGLRLVRFPRARFRDLCQTSAQFHRLGDLAGADLCSAAAAVLVARYLERRDAGCTQ